MDMTLPYLQDKKKYFKEEGTKTVFTGTELKVFIPENYEGHGLLTIENTAKTLGVLRYEIDGKFYSNMMFLGMFDIAYSEVYKRTYYGQDYYELTLVNGDAFVNSRTVIKSGDILYAMFVAFLALGKIPGFLSYDNIYSMFDNDQAHCGINLNVQSVIFEMIYSHIYRDGNDPSKFYRHTKMTELPSIVALHMIGYSPVSNLAKVMGSYMNDGMISSLASAPEGRQEIENLFRV